MLIHTMTSELDVPTAASPAASTQIDRAQLQVVTNINRHCKLCLLQTFGLHGRLQSFLQVLLIFIHFPKLQQT